MVLIAKMLLARLCNTTAGMNGVGKHQRRHSWSSEFDYHSPARSSNDPYSEDESQISHDVCSDDDDLSSSDKSYLEFDLIAACHSAVVISSSEDEDKSTSTNQKPSFYQISGTMGQGSSLHNTRPKLSLTWVLKNGTNDPKHIVPTPEPPIKFQYSKTRRKSLGNISKSDHLDTIAKKSDTFIKKLVKRDESVKSAKVKSIKSDPLNNKYHINYPEKRGKKEQNPKNTGECSSEKSVQTDKQIDSNISSEFKSEKNYYGVHSDFITKQVGNPNDALNSSKTYKLVDKWQKQIATKENVYCKKPDMRYQNHINAKYELYPVRNTKENLVRNEALSIQKRTASEPTLVPSSERQREKQRHKRRSRSRIDRRISKFGYDIDDIDTFLTKASLEKPANIPVVLSHPSVLYQTQYDGYQDEIPLPLGMVVNAVFKKESWLYVQTPHGEEGYVTYTACLPLGIIPQKEESKMSPCWETSTDLFPKPCGNMTDSEKLTRSECGDSRCKRRVRRSTLSTCGERSVDRLYLRAAANSKVRDVKRQTLLIVDADYSGKRKNTITVSAGDVVALISAPIKGWFWVRSRDGSEGFIPAAIAGNGFL